MSSYTKANLRQVEDQAPNFGMPAEMQARFARTPLEGKSLGLSLFTLAPSFRTAWSARILSASSPSNKARACS